MRVSRAEMNLSHERIVKGAARLFRERGVENTSVADVMEAAGLTHGGFYRHFEAKDALVSAAIKSAFQQVIEMIDARLGDKESEVVLTKYRSHYLSEGHLSHPGAACPVATMAGEMARASPDLKSEFGDGVQQMIEVLARYHDGRGSKQRHAEATREFALLVGAAVIARACDAETAKEVLSACR